MHSETPVRYPCVIDQGRMGEEQTQFELCQEM